jgi:hypothetical protein
MDIKNSVWMGNLCTTVVLIARRGVPINAPSGIVSSDFISNCFGSVHQQSINHKIDIERWNVFNCMSLLLSILVKIQNYSYRAYDACPKAKLFSSWYLLVFSTPTWSLQDSTPRLHSKTPLHDAISPFSTCPQKNV